MYKKQDISLYIYLSLYIYKYIYKYTYLQKNQKLHIFYKRCAPEYCGHSASGNVCACLFWGVNCRFTFC